MQGRKKARSPILAAGGVVLRSSREPLIAVVQLRKYNDWVLPKGKINYDESALAAARREVLEEVGHKTYVHAFLGTIAYDVGERIKFFSEVAVGAHRARDASIERIEEDGETDGAGSVVEVSHFAVECGENCVVTAQKIGNGENAGKDVDAAAEAVFAKRISRPFFVTDRI